MSLLSSSVLFAFLSLDGSSDHVLFAFSTLDGSSDHIVFHKEDIRTKVRERDRESKSEHEGAKERKSESENKSEAARFNFKNVVLLSSLILLGNISNVSVTTSTVVVSATTVASCGGGPAANLIPSLFRELHIYLLY